MPQFNIADAVPQIIWLILVFLILYLSVTATLPKVEKVVTDRKAHILADIGAAEAARAAAVAESSHGSDAVAHARAEALGLTSEAQATAAAKLAAKLAEVDRHLDEKGAAAAQALAAAQAAALAELDQVAAEATRDLVARVASVRISDEEAQSMVKKVAA